MLYADDGYIVQATQIKLLQGFPCHDGIMFHKQRRNGMIRKAGILQRKISSGQVERPHHAVMLSTNLPHKAGYGLLRHKIVSQHLSKNLDGRFKVFRYDGLCPQLAQFRFFTDKSGSGYNIQAGVEFVRAVDHGPHRGAVGNDHGQYPGRNVQASWDRWHRHGEWVPYPDNG